jgi:parallel beta-helix repeat protein
VRTYLFLPAVFVVLAPGARAATINVPADQKTIQAGIDAAKPGDTVLVAPGTYRESVRLKDGVTLRSAGDDAKGAVGLKRAEATVIEGDGPGAKRPAVVLAEGATLDGFTVTKVGAFDQKTYDRHYDTHGELLADDEGAVGAGGNFPAVGIPGVAATVRNCIVHDNGTPGIGCTGAKERRIASEIAGNVVYRNMGGGIGIADGAAPLVAKNRCYQNLRGGIGNRASQALILDNECFDNVRAGIGIREGATPLVRGNKCYKNRRAGIGVRMKGTDPIIENNECYENEMAGIGNRDGAAPVIRNNKCYRNKMAGIGSRDGARAVIEGNECYENDMAGIGSRNGATPVIRNNKCYRNKMAGIGSRDGAKPVIDGNECFENEMAGIGSRDGAEPIIRGNNCYKNEMAGIGSRLGAKPVIVGNTCTENKLAGIGSEHGAEPLIINNRCVKNQLAGIGSHEGARVILIGNECRENGEAGIGLRDKATATILNNKCVENAKVAVGVRTGSTAYIAGNDFNRTGGMPPMIAVFEGSQVVITRNRIKGGGVAGIIVDGTATITDNTMEGGEKSGSAVWARPKADVTIRNNRVDRYRNLVSCSDCRITVTDNVVSQFQGTAITVKKSLAPATVYGNVALSKNPKDTAATVEGEKGVVAENTVRDPDQADKFPAGAGHFWLTLKGEQKRDPLPYELRTGESVVQDGPWKLRITHGKTTTYKLFNTVTDPGEKTDLAPVLESLVFRLRGKFERQDSVTGRGPPGKGPGK